jgi:hypothetical protein
VELLETLLIVLGWLLNILLSDSANTDLDLDTHITNWKSVCDGDSIHVVVSSSILVISWLLHLSIILSILSTVPFHYCWCRAFV